jgi:hypothetical protein
VLAVVKLFMNPMLTLSCSFCVGVLMRVGLLLMVVLSSPAGSVVCSVNVNVCLTNHSYSQMLLLLLLLKLIRDRSYRAK